MSLVINTLQKIIQIKITRYETTLKNKLTLLLALSKRLSELNE